MFKYLHIWKQHRQPPTPPAIFYTLQTEQKEINYVPSCSLESVHPLPVSGVLRRDSVPPGGEQRFKGSAGLRVKWNTPLDVRCRRSESQPGCRRRSLGCLPVWRRSLPGSDTSLFAGSGTLRRYPGRPKQQRSPLRWRLQDRGQIRRSLIPEDGSF